jgi:hypothetical protein
MRKCNEGEGGKCLDHNSALDGGHTDWGDEPVCDWYAAMFVHGECAVCPAVAVTPVRRRRNRKERNSA